MALTDNLVSYWKLDDDATDAHGSNDLTNNNSATFAAAKINDGVSLASASSQYLSIADNAGVSTGDIDFTLQAWVNLGSNANQGPVVGKWAAGTREFLLIFNNGANTFTFFVSSDGSAAASVSAITFGAPSVDTWYLVHCWHDATNDQIGISVNAGAADTVSHTAGVHDGTASFDIGRNAEGAFFEGLIDEVGFWKRVLTSTERTSLYNSGSGLSYNDASFAGSASATTYTLTGPSTGTVGVASSNFTVTPDAAVSADVVVTPDDGGTGTFTPSTVTFASGTSTAQTFTYTPASAGVKTISTTNDGGLTDPSSLSFTASAASSFQAAWARNSTITLKAAV